MNLKQPDVLEYFLSGLVFTAAAVIVNWVAYLKNYFKTPYLNAQGPFLRLSDLLWFFGIFFFIALFGAPILFILVKDRIPLNLASDLTVIGIQVLVFFLTVFLWLIYTSISGIGRFFRVIKDYDFMAARSILYDIGFGLVSFIVAGISTLAISGYFEALSILLFGASDHEQLAVRYLKKAMQTPSGLVCGLFTILVVAPLLEEYLFRGILLTWLRDRMGAIKAVFLSAFLFALFHFAPSQYGLNLPIVATLFVFGSYLGFVYEKTRSLITPIFLHVTFNLISVIRIIFSGE